jgi:hypothetical protein
MRFAAFSQLRSRSREPRLIAPRRCRVGTHKLYLADHFCLLKAHEQLRFVCRR